MLNRAAQNIEASISYNRPFQSSPPPPTNIEHQTDWYEIL